MRPRASVARGIGIAPGVGVAFVFGIALAAVLTGCSTGDDDAGRSDVDGPTTTAVAGDPGDADGGNDSSNPRGTSVGVPSSEPVPAESLAAIPELGVPGLDSDEVVCRAWSRFGGSFQVLAVMANFGSSDPVAVAALEVIASPTVTGAYDDLITNWPDELADEAEVAADDFFGPFNRRADRALAELEAAGADATAMATIVAAWESALAERDPNRPEIIVELPDDVRTLVDVAASELASQLVPIPSDPSLVTDVDVPLTEQYLADNCPDRGTLGGVDG